MATTTTNTKVGEKDAPVKTGKNKNPNPKKGRKGGLAENNNRKSNKSKQCQHHHSPLPLNREQRARLSALRHSYKRTLKKQRLKLVKKLAELANNGAIKLKPGAGQEEGNGSASYVDYEKWAAYLAIENPHLEGKV